MMNGLMQTLLRAACKQSRPCQQQHTVICLSTDVLWRILRELWSSTRASDAKNASVYLYC